MPSLIKISPEESAPLVVDEQPLDDIQVVLGWRNAGTTKQRGFGAFKQRLGKRGTDLDAAALLCNAAGQVVAACGVDDADPFRGSIVHAGDDAGKSTDASEAIAVTLSRLPAVVEAVVFTLCSFDGKGFDTVNSATFEILAAGETRVQTMLPINETGKNAAIMAVVRRSGDTWEIQDISKLVFVDPHFGGNRDSAVTWKDLGQQYAHLFRVRR